MKPLPPPEVSGKTAAERFNNALRTVLTHPRAKIAAEKNGPKQQRISDERQDTPEADEVAVLRSLPSKALTDAVDFDNALQETAKIPDQF